MSGKQPVERIPLVAPVPSVLTSARDVTTTLGQWRTGIAWQVGSCVPSAAWPRCPTPGSEKDAAAGVDVATTDSFRAYTPVSCEWVTAPGADRLDALANDLTDAHTAAAIGRALWMGEGLPDVPDAVWGTLPPTLRRSAVPIDGGTSAQALDDAVAQLLAAYEACTGGNGGAVLHVPTALVVSALGGGGGGSRVCWPEGSLYRGPLGSIVSPGPGYPHGQSNQGAGGFGPLVDGSEPEEYRGNAADEVWVYVSGPVEYALGPVEPPNTQDERGNPRRTNLYEVLAERDALVRIDPCCVRAALVVNDAGEGS